MGAQDLRAGRLASALGAALPEQRSARVVHGDYRVDNVIIDAEDPGRVLAVVDWDWTTQGDPVADVALMCVRRHPALDGVLGIDAAWTSDRFPDVDTLRSMHEKRSGDA